RIKVVGAEAALDQFGRGIGFPDGPLAGAEHGHAVGAGFADRRFDFFRHDIEGLVPAYRGELALLVVLAIFHTQHRRAQAIAAIHDLRQEVAFDAVQAAIDIGFYVAVSGNDFVVFGRHHHAAAHSAETAGRLVPFQ